MNKATKTRQPKTYELAWEFVPRIAVEHLGSHKYTTSTKALRELVANGFDAGATEVKIYLHENGMGGLASVIVEDNGRGISPVELRERFCKIGIAPTPHSSRLGRFGIGRLAVHRIGNLSEWQSTSKGKGSGAVRVSFTMSSDMAHGLSPLTIREEAISLDETCGTWIKILNLLDDSHEKLTPARIRSDLVSQFCSFLLGNPNRRIFVQDEPLDVRSFVAEEESERFFPFGRRGPSATMRHLMLAGSVEQSRFPAQLIFSGKGVTVAHLKTEKPPAPQYLGIVDCDYLNEIVTADREALIEMDDGFTQLKQIAVLRMNEYATRRHQQLARGFIERARSESFYPYQGAPVDSVTGVEQAVYDVVLEKLNETTNIEGMTKRQQEVVFRLLRRALENENLIDVLDEVARLSDEDMEKFRRVLERTTLDCIIKLSSEVTSRLTFLDILHHLVYGPDAKHLKERAHLHKIVEPQCWLFGPRFHLATSDKSFRRVIQEHRKLAGLSDVDDPDFANINGISDIPDLFLAATREYPIEPRNHHVLVELKAPSVTLGGKERDQIRRYARIIRESQELDKLSTHWDLFLVSSKVSAELEDDRRQKGKAHGILWEWDDMTVWAMEWREIIQAARDELGLVRQHLRHKSQELTVREYLMEHFPSVLDDLDSRTHNSRKSPPTSPQNSPSAPAPRSP